MLGILLLICIIIIILWSMYYYFTGQTKDVDTITFNNKVPYITIVLKKPYLGSVNQVTGASMKTTNSILLNGLINVPLKIDFKDSTRITSNTVPISGLPVEKITSSGGTVTIY